jgi:hypothetical protein
MNKPLFLSILLTISGVANSDTKYFCTECVVQDSISVKFCGLYDSTVRKWVNGRKITCGSVSTDTNFGCSVCTVFPEQLGGVQQCGYFFVATKKWHRVTENRLCTPPTAPIDPGRPSYNLPPMVSPPVAPPTSDFCWEHPIHPSCTGGYNHCRDNPSDPICGQQP